jgi:exodeoxyribonuclease VII large subunit
VSRLIDRESAKLASCGDALRHNAELMLQQKEQTVARIASELEALSPLSTLARGYCVATGVDGQVIRQAAQLQPDDELSIRWPDGSRTCRVVS